MFTYDALMDGLHWASQLNAKVMCICTGQRFSLPTPGRMIEEFSLAGGGVVCAIGNNGSDDGGVFPARYPHAIAAGSVDDNGELLPFVELHEGTDLFCFGGMPFNAPVRDHQYGEFGGTSVSAALISGMIAIAISSGKLQLTPEHPTIKAKLLSTMEKKLSSRGPYYLFDPLKLA
jgi:hypothetical protein